MYTVAGVSLLSRKKVYISLQYIYGIGKYRSSIICLKNCINKHKPIDTLSLRELNLIRSFIDIFYYVEGDLRVQLSLNIKKLLDIKCYRGIRHKTRLPVRGQRTHTNAKTRKLKK